DRRCSVRAFDDSTGGRLRRFAAMPGMWHACTRSQTANPTSSPLVRSDLEEAAAKRIFTNASSRKPRDTCKQRSRSSRAHRWSCYAHMGRLSEARDLIERLRAIASIIPPPRRDNLKPEDRELMQSGLRLAMGETE